MPSIRTETRGRVMSIAGQAAAALDSLSSSQIYFLQSLPKAELHAHLNGSIPISVLQELGSEYESSVSSPIDNESIKTGISKLRDGPSLETISEFFTLFPAIYALTSTPDSLRRATRAVLSTFLDGDMPQCSYLELRTTPRQTVSMNRNKYLRVVLEELERYGRSRVGLIISLDRRMSDDVLSECVTLACELKGEGKFVVGMDLCGDPAVGDIDMFAPHFAELKKIGLGVTLHIAEV
jgi:adenosine deaminase